MWISVESHHKPIKFGESKKVIFSLFGLWNSRRQTEKKSCACLWYCKSCYGTPGYWLSYVNTHWFSLEEIQYISTGAGNCCFATPPPNTHTGETTNKHKHTPKSCVVAELSWFLSSYSYFYPPNCEAFPSLLCLLFTPSLSDSCMQWLFRSLLLCCFYFFFFFISTLQFFAFISSLFLSVLFRLWHISPMIKLWTGGLMGYCCMKCWQDR